MRRAIIFVLAGASALAMNGCVVFKTTPTASQGGVVGSVRITVTGCASQSGGSPPAGSCAAKGNSVTDASTDPSQVFLAFRVPRGSVSPQSFSSSQTGPSNSGPQLTFDLSPSYSNELQRLAPAGSGEQWVGFVSRVFSYNSASGEQNFTASVDFGLPPGANGGPFSGPFTYQAVVGGRALPASSPNDPVECPGKYPSYGTTNGLDWACVDDQFPSTIGADALVTVRDAGIVPGAAVTAKPGSTASVPFTFGYVGTPPGSSFGLSASTTLAGATPSTNPGTVTPTGTSNTPVTVSVAVPKKATPGTYPVTLTARSATGETRTGTVLLTVPGCQVPDLTAKRLSKAKKALKAAKCKLGKRHGHGKYVVSQKPVAGTLLALGGKVSVKLG